MVPLALSVHRWLVPPLQSQICVRAPAAAFSGASRHLPSAWRVWPLSVQRWFVPPLQSQMIGWVPLVVLPPGTSRQRPDAVPTSAAPVPVDGSPSDPGTERRAEYQVAAILS